MNHCVIHNQGPMGPLGKEGIPGRYGKDGLPGDRGIPGYPVSLLATNGKSENCYLYICFF